ncbi:MAG TPA: ROK family glucokinase [Actinomycetes bacterium]|nr:ROK family glucokinase [Actinomycetes bacterium]
MTLTIGVDIGGTKVAGGVVDEEGRILAQHRVSTPARDAAATTDAIVSVIGTLRGAHEDIEAVGLGIAGFVDASRSVVYFAPNLLGWRDGPLRAEVEARIGLPVVVENDANAAAWGEARFGAGQGERFIVCVTLGTGVGGGIIADRQLFRGGFGVGAEIGHIQMVEDGRLCGCGQRGCWEQYASGGALLRDARERAAESREEAELLLSLGDGTPEGIEGRHVTEAAHAGDPVAVASFDQLGHWVGQGLADLAAVLDPECFVLGGGVSEAGDVLLRPTVASFEQLLTGHGHRPLAKVLSAQLGNDAGLVGAADLARYR